MGINFDGVVLYCGGNDGCFTCYCYDYYCCV